MKRDPVFLDADPSTGVPSMSALELRNTLACFQPGVFDPGDFKVVPATGLNVASAPGRAIVAASSGGVTYPGSYLCVDDAPEEAITMEGGPIPANASTNPRLDAVVLQVFDASLDGSGRREWVRTYLPGVAAPGVVLGGSLPAIPANSLLIAEVLVPANNPSSIPSGNIRDRRPWARGARWNAALSTRATTATAYGGIDTVNAQPRLELSGRPVTLRISGVLSKTSTNDTVSFDLLDNGADITGDLNAVLRTDTRFTGTVFLWTWVPAAGTHVLLPRWKVSSGGASLFSSTIEVFEDLRASAANT